MGFYGLPEFPRNRCACADPTSARGGLKSTVTLYIMPPHIMPPHMEAPALERELKRGSTELLILALMADLKATPQRTVVE
jgi:hypothetical protein